MARPGSVRGLLTIRFVRDPPGTLVRIARERGDVASYRVGSLGETLVSDPELVRHVLVTANRSFAKGRALQKARPVIGEGLLTSEGSFHLRQRRLMQPLFHQRAVESYAAAMVAEAGRAQASWQSDQVLDLHEEMAKLTLAIVARTLFDADVAGDAHRIGRALTEAMEGVSRRIYPLGSWFELLPLPASRRYAAARATLDATIEQLIEERRSDPSDRDDLLSLLLRTRDEDAGGMTDVQVRDEAMTLFLAGHETTAVWLTWTLMLLAQHPDVEEAVRDELTRVVGARPPLAGDLGGLELLERVLSESLRLYPPVWLIGRRALEPVELPGHRIPRGRIVVTSQWVVHHDPRWYPDPWSFDPDRWTDEARRGRPDYAFFPFGGGTRMCIGERFAWMEAKLILATILPHWSIRLTAGPARPLPRITLRPRGGLPAIVGRRSP